MQILIKSRSGHIFLPIKRASAMIIYIGFTIFSSFFLFSPQRENAVDNFRAGKTWVLIATDVISRGMDFKGVNCVINYDFPESAASYIHRIGMLPLQPLALLDW